MRKDLDYNGLTYFSSKLKTYIAKKLKEVTDSISFLSSKVDFDKDELENRINTTKSDLSTNIQDVDSKVDNVNSKIDNKYQELKISLDAADFRPTGDTIKINNIEQFVFKDITAGETIVIPHDEDNTSFLIECFAKTELTTPLVHKVIDINTANADLLEYDPRYVEITNSGAKPKDSITLELTKQQTYNGYNVYVTEMLPIELVDSIENLTTYTLS